MIVILLECMAKPSVLAARPLGGLKLVVKYECGIIQANATEMAMQAWAKPWVTSANH